MLYDASAFSDHPATDLEALARVGCRRRDHTDHCVCRDGDRWQKHPKSGPRAGRVLLGAFRSNPSRHFDITLPRSAEGDMICVGDALFESFVAILNLD